MLDAYRIQAQAGPVTEQALEHLHESPGRSWMNSPRTYPASPMTGISVQ